MMIRQRERDVRTSGLVEKIHNFLDENCYEFIKDNKHTVRS